MRKIDLIVIHCSATRPSMDVGAAEIKQWHKARGFRTIGYHYVVRLDGTIERGRSEYQMGAHCAGYNAFSLGVCYVGGLNQQGEPADTRTPAQRRSLQRLMNELKKKYPLARVVGHRDLNKHKACPCFDVATSL